MMGMYFCYIPKKAGGAIIRVSLADGELFLQHVGSPITERHCEYRRVEVMMNPNE